MRRGGPLKRRTRIKNTGMEKCPPKVRKALLARSDGVCELCLTPLGIGWHAHHRKLRVQGGTWALSNTLACCGPCHSGIHRDVAASYERGRLVRSWDDPRTVWCRTVLHGFCFLGDDGSVIYNPNHARTAAVAADSEAAS